MMRCILKSMLPLHTIPTGLYVHIPDINIQDILSSPTVCNVKAGLGVQGADSPARSIWKMTFLKWF